MNKYRNVRTNGFASKKESRRYDELLLLERAGHISNLETQVSYDLKVNGMKICRYVSDFNYTQWEIAGSAVLGSKSVVEDCKGVKTPIYRLKKKLMKAIHGIEITEV